MKASTLILDLVSAAALLNFTSIGLASHDGVWQRLRELVGEEYHEDSAVHGRDQDAYTNPLQQLNYHTSLYSIYFHTFFCNIFDRCIWKQHSYPILPLIKLWHRWHNQLSSLDLYKQLDRSKFELQLVQCQWLFYRGWRLYASGLVIGESYEWKHQHYLKQPPFVVVRILFSARNEPQWHDVSVTHGVSALSINGIGDVGVSQSNNGHCTIKLAFKCDSLRDRVQLFGPKWTRHRDGSKFVTAEYLDIHGNTSAAVVQLVGTNGSGHNIRDRFDGAKQWKYHAFGIRDCLAFCSLPTVQCHIAFGTQRCAGFEHRPYCFTIGRVLNNATLEYHDDSGSCDSNTIA
ncbi:hypothetical protein NKR19_g6879 [Coniochaeta hoffmannii]|uniref:Apple domain-containing protein n=1 Tax=Coniochaeta hoffmannii TaxID=91930 RepID=A0AA38RQ57_9PEZI|nr:hypothetical protein NKR19_g6879 [Coniochaeta hoffmannii]